MREAACLTGAIELLTSGPARGFSAVFQAMAPQTFVVAVAASSGDISAIGQICDRHGGALFALARAIVGDATRAEAVVVEVIARACADPGATTIGAGVSLRRELARLTYLYSIRCLEDTHRPVGGSALARIAALSELARRQRSALALVQYGNHTVDDVADLLNLFVPAVALLLTAGLRDLQAADRRAADEGRR